MQKGGVRALDKFKEGMDDDFNTPKALATVNSLIKESYAIMEHELTHKDFWATLYYNFNALKEIVELFGLELELKEDKVTAEIKSLLNERVEARKRKDFKRSDELRDLLKAEGIIVEDTPKGQKWRRA